MKKLKILQVCPHPYEEGVGGISEYVRNISKVLAEVHDVKVFATDPRGGLPKYEVIDNVEVERYRRWAPGRAYYFSIELLSKLRADKYDVVHTHSYVTFPFQVSFLANCDKLICSTHLHEGSTSDFRNLLLKLYNPLGRSILNNSHAIIAVSDYEKGLIIDRFDIPSSKISVIPCGLNLEEFVTTNVKKQNLSGKKNLLYVGRLDDYKGVKYLVEVIPYLDDDVCLSLVGRGPIKQYIIDRSVDLKISDRIHFYESIPRAELLELFVNADLFLLLSKYEAYSISVAEALMSSVPCIVADSSALTEWIDNKYCFGIKYPIDVTLLAELISTLLEKNINVEVSSLLNTKIMSWKNVAEKVEGVYLS